MNDAILETEGLTKRYGARVGVSGLSLRVPSGVIYGFLGPNGSGKTTTIRLLLGLLRPSAGSATVLGKDAWRESPQIKQSVGYIPGDLRLYGWMTAKSALHIFGQVRGMPLATKGLALAERFGLDATVRVHRMSRGMRQKLGLILALAHEPELLILDEPTTALDPPMQQALYDVLRERVAEGATVFFSSHTLSEVESLCERVALLRNGELIADETMERLRARAERVVTLTWRSAGASDSTGVPPFLRVIGRRNATWHCALSGSVTDLVKWCAEQPLDDLSISPPDLDTLFRRMYQPEAK